MVLTGGPGTGKTTTTMGIISAYRMAGCRIILSAPTGRATKRMSETTGVEINFVFMLIFSVISDIIKAMGTYIALP